MIRWLLLGLLLAVVLYLWWRSKTPEPTQFTIAIGGTNMDLQIFDDGKGVKFTATPDHPLLAGEVPTWALADSTGAPSAALVLSVDATGLVCTGTLPTPVIDGTGFVATITLKENSGVTITDKAAPIDIVPHPTEAGSFVITESAL